MKRLIPLIITFAVLLINAVLAISGPATRYGVPRDSSQTAAQAPAPVAINPEASTLLRTDLQRVKDAQNALNLAQLQLRMDLKDVAHNANCWDCALQEDAKAQLVLVPVPAAAKASPKP